MEWIVTTSFGMDKELVARAKALARLFGVAYVERRKDSVKKLQERYGHVLVLYQDKLVFEQLGGERLFFHPDTALLRIKSGRDPLLELIGEGPKRICDCTMGLASDSIVMASAGHQVTAIESSRLIAFLVSQGLQELDTGNEAVNSAMRSIEVIEMDSLSFLRRQPSQSFDIVYFDPMFSETIRESQNLAGLAGLANPSRLTEELLEEAKRVARKKIILKAHFRDRIFEDLGFSRLVRPNQKFHYGIWRKPKSEEIQ
ncbi:class I SAM-dependent methyltransferase [Streptococcus cuniculi]|uniref:SAM-dependent methyltransferase n=1 Tax=Streptococcus cuniculi TaxID=1432788 RepID=A0A4Y9JEF3_9STRE|nr:class I SAM-dependent methyltransferase [Streptococcus cuniculi]MBF0777771.1 class I SAM-dependent methyltransferase [Streptococcus cuniculi]TFU98406.1 SAM-dependent methyltransferase [Streptococcus cuniculi]